jgi:hypothetical protein
MTSGSIVWGAFLEGAYWFKKVEIDFNMSFSSGEYKADDLKTLNPIDRGISSPLN